MRKIPTLFRRVPGQGVMGGAVTPGAEWVVAGDGLATRKYDGTCCRVRGGRLWKRYDAKVGRTPPDGFEPAEPAPDPVTGHWPGWVLIEPTDYWHLEAWAHVRGMLADGTYELCGPKINGNPEGYPAHVLIAHAEAESLVDAPRTFDGLRAYLVGRNTAEASIEGIVWHHPDGRMVKIKLRDFGVSRVSRTVR